MRSKAKSNQQTKAKEYQQFIIPKPARKRRKQRGASTRTVN